MKYTGIELLQAIKDGRIADFTKVKVIYLGIPTKHILEVTRDNLMWKPGEFCVGELWDDEYTFEIIEEKPKKIEEFETTYSMNMVEMLMQDKINELQKAVNYLLEKESDK